MKKRSLVCLIALVLMLVFSFSMPNFAFAEEENNGDMPIEISSYNVMYEKFYEDFAQDSVINNNYILTADINLYDTITSELNLDESNPFYNSNIQKNLFSNFEFGGEIDGNGYKLYGEINSPLFGRISGSIFNLEISPIQNNQNTSLNLGNIQETEISYGFLAKEIYDGNLENIVIKNAKIKHSIADNTTSQLTTNSYIGFMAGKVLNGASIKNCVIENCEIDLTIGETSGGSFNFGGVSGVIENSEVANVIVNLRNTSDHLVIPSISIESLYSKSVNIGGISGLSDYANSCFYNNVVFLDSQNIVLSNNISCNLGSMFGNLKYELYVSNLQGFITTATELDFFGTRYAVTQNYQNLEKISYEDFSSSLFSDTTKWMDIQQYKWNFDKTWTHVAGAKYPDLQCFKTLGFSFDKDLSKQTLPILGNLPKYDVVKYSINGEDKSNKFDYGTDVELVVEINSKQGIENEEFYTNYEKFFYISALELNGKTIYNNETNMALEGYNISIKESLVQFEDGLYRPTSVTYVISNININYEGNYNVVLGRNTFLMDVNVYEIELDDNSKFVPGKFVYKNEELNQKVLELQYGNDYVLTTADVDGDYSNKAFWYVFDNSEKNAYDDTFVKFNPLETSENHYGNAIEFTFDEDCSLFSVPQGSPNAKIFDITKATEIDGKPNYELKIVYVTKVKQIKIVFRDQNNNDLNIKEEDVKILIDNSDERIVYSEDDKAFYSKVTFDMGATPSEVIKTTHSIKLDQISSDYEFIAWQYEFGALETDDDYKNIGILEVDQNTEEPLVIYCLVKNNKKASASNLLWLWILLACLGVAAIVVVIIIVVKKKRANSSYKKFYF